MDAGSYAGVASIWPLEVQADCKAWWTVVSAPGVASTLFGRRDVITLWGLLPREVKKVGFARQPIGACVVSYETTMQTQGQTPLRKFGKTDARVSALGQIGRAHV